MTEVSGFPGLESRKSKPLERAYVNEGTRAATAISKATGGDKLKERLAAKPPSAKKSSATGPPAKQPSSTRAVALLQQKTRENLEQKKAEDARRAQED